MNILKVTALIDNTTEICQNQSESNNPDQIESTPKKSENLLNLKTQFNLAFDAFHAAEQKGLFNLKLKDCLSSSPLHQRRQLKRSTSSNASSESNISTNSISSCLSTSNASTYTHLINSTPSKQQQQQHQVQHSSSSKSNCNNKQSLNNHEIPFIFNFNDSYVNEYLQQQQAHTQNTSVFNRPITRSITHHNNKVNNADSVLEQASKKHLPTVFDFKAISGCNEFTKVNVANSTGGSFFSSSSSTSSLSSSSSDLKLFITTKSINPITPSSQNQNVSGSDIDTESSCDTFSQPPACKRLKRCPTILID